jgi:hypothetical protein
MYLHFKDMYYKEAVIYERVANDLRDVESRTGKFSTLNSQKAQQMFTAASQNSEKNVHKFLDIYITEMLHRKLYLADTM